MKFLAFDTSTEQLRIAAGDGASVLAQRESAGGAQASAALLPAILDVLREAGWALAALDAIVFGRGPGSFTGLRTACSVAQGLALGAHLPVLPVDTLLAVAQDAHARTGATQVVAALDARMGEVYWAPYRRENGAWTREAAIALGDPADVRVPAGWLLAGNAVAAYPSYFADDDTCADAVPAATALLSLAPALLAAGGAVDAAHAIPLYIRDKVAQTTEERAAARAASPPAP